MENNMEELRKKPRKKSRPSEVLDLPRQYLVKTDSGIHVVQANSKEQAVEPYRQSRTMATAGLMGTHESERHAQKRLWF